VPGAARDPVYRRLVDRLRGRIRSAADPAGARFLTERVVAGRYGVSRPTANKALAALVAEGTLEFRKGVGTFVRGGALDVDLAALVSFTEKARAAGRSPSTRVLRFERRAADALPDAVRGALRPAEGDAIYYMERLRLADGVPVILERRHLSARRCPGLDRRAVSGSLYTTLTARYRLRIAAADEVVRAVTLGRKDAKILGTQAGAAGLLVTAVATLEGGEPLWREETLYRGDAYEIRSRVGPVRAASGALAGPGLPRKARKVNWRNSL
jgi:GntR family transcriptional regulator